MARGGRPRREARRRREVPRRDLRIRAKGHRQGDRAAQEEGRGAPPAAKVCDRADVFIAGEFGGWQAVCLGILADKFDAAAKTFPPINELLDAVKASPLAEQADFKNVLKMVMPFLKFKMTEAQTVGAEALATKLVFDEAGVLTENMDFVLRSCGLKELRVLRADEEGEERAAAVAGGVKVDQATPGSPAWHYHAVEDLAGAVDGMDIGK